MSQPNSYAGVFTALKAVEDIAAAEVLLVEEKPR